MREINMNDYKDYDNCWREEIFLEVIIVSSEWEVAWLFLWIRNIRSIIYLANFSFFSNCEISENSSISSNLLSLNESSKDSSLMKSYINYI